MLEATFEIVTGSSTWGHIEGDIQEQTDLIDLIDETKGDIEQDISDLAQVVDDNYNTLDGKIDDEITNRSNADDTLQGNIDTLSGTVSDNYNTLDGKIDTTKQTLEGAISDEETARINADTTLQGNIDTLSGTVTSNYNTLDGKITDEATARGNADTTLQNNIDTLSGTVSSNYTTLNGKITDEATARGNADDVLDGKISNNKTSIDNHVADKTNPHEVTKAQVGLGNVDNTSDLNKPISTATQNALNTKVSNTREINGYALSSDITLTASDVDALPDTTTINDLTTAEQQSALNSGATSTNIGQIATNTQNISNEVTNRQNADNNLQSQIDALVVASDVFDIVGTYAELQAYDISTVPVNDIIKVLVDSTHNNAATYYRCIENDNVKSWSYIGAEGAYYTKSEADNRFVEQTTTVNGQALSGNITLTASDVGALPDSTVIGNGTLTIQKNGSTINTFGANDTGNTTVNITVPTDTSDLTNNAGYIKGINSTDVTTALGYTPYDSTNPDGYTDNVGTVTSVNNTQPDANGNVTLSIPAAQVNSDWNASSGVAQILNKPTLSTVATTGDYDDLTNKPTIPAAQVQSNWNESDTTSKAYIQNKPSLSTVATSGNYNDLSNKPTIPTVNNATLTITQGGTTKGTFTANAGTDVTIDLDAGGGSSTDVQINGTSITSNGVANIVTNTAYNASSNKIATMSDVPSDYLTNTATGTGSLIIGGEASDRVGATSVGYTSVVGANNTTAIGYNSQATSQYSITIGKNSKTSGASAIQIGYGTNSTANTLSVGFYNNSSTHYNWQLLDGTTGKIPTARIDTDTTATSGSAKPITSGAVYTIVGNIESALNTINSGSST